MQIGSEHVEILEHCFKACAKTACSNDSGTCRDPERAWRIQIKLGVIDAVSTQVEATSRGESRDFICTPCMCILILIFFILL